MGREPPGCIRGLTTQLLYFSKESRIRQPRPSSCQIRRLELSPCTVSDGEHFHTLLSFQDAIDHTIDVRLVAVQQVSELVLLSRHGEPVRLRFQAEDSRSETPVPFQGGVGMRGVDFLIPSDAAETCSLLFGSTQFISFQSLHSPRVKM